MICLLVVLNTAGCASSKQAGKTQTSGVLSSAENRMGDALVRAARECPCVTADVIQIMCSLGDIFDVSKRNSDLMMYGDISMSAEYFIRLRGFLEEDGVVDWLLENGFTANSVMFEFLFDPPPSPPPPAQKPISIPRGRPAYIKCAVCGTWHSRGIVCDASAIRPTGIKTVAT